MNKILTATIAFTVCTMQFLAAATPGTPAMKTVHVPSSFGKMDLKDSSSQWCYARSRQSENWIIFWEAGYGDDPGKAAEEAYRVNVDRLLNIAERCFAAHRDILKFITPGHSRTDKYKMIILLFHTKDWIASGSGVDDVIGQLNLSAWSARASVSTLAHEVGHCFQYQVACDGNPGGWRYGFGKDASGGNGWWEQCAQWQAFEVFPEEQFGDVGDYYAKAHLHPLHESARYASHFIQDFWSFKHGINIIGRLWRESIKPEDPIEAYERLTGTSQDKFNDEIYECAARFVTWDIPALMEQGRQFVADRPSARMQRTADGAWIIDPSQCIQNYGYNVIRLNVPEGDLVTVNFEGKAGAEGYRAPRGIEHGGWRYGLVALTEGEKRFYSEMRSPRVRDGLNPKDTFTEKLPNDVARLWLVVTGAPSQHWRHPWDDDEKNDEQWPYQVKFKNTDLYGTFAFTDRDVPHDATITNEVTLAPVESSAQQYPSVPVEIDAETLCRAFRLQLPELKKKIGSAIAYCAIAPNGTKHLESTARAPGHWFDHAGNPTAWKNNCHIFSELKPDSLTFRIGQFPGVCKAGDKVTITQALVYTSDSGKPVTVTCVFNIRIADSPTRQ